MCTNEKSKAAFSKHLAEPTQHAVKSFEVVIIPVLNVENTHMQISHKRVIQACHDFKILTHTSKGEEINFKFQCIQFIGYWVKIESNIHSTTGLRNFHN